METVRSGGEFVRVIRYTALNPLDFSDGLSSAIPTHEKLLLSEAHELLQSDDLQIFKSMDASNAQDGLDSIEYLLWCIIKTQESNRCLSAVAVLCCVQSVLEMLDF